MEANTKSDVIEIFVAAMKMNEPQRQRLLGIAEGILIAAPQQTTADE